MPVSVNQLNDLWDEVTAESAEFWNDVIGRPQPQLSDTHLAPGLQAKANDAWVFSLVFATQQAFAVQACQLARNTSPPKRAGRNGCILDDVAMSHILQYPEKYERLQPYLEEEFPDYYAADGNWLIAGPPPETEDGQRSDRER